ncbi:hypothetical protein ACVBKF_29065, partial [Shewanella sp. 0m-11]
KQSFRLIFMFTVLINIALVAGIHTDSGSKLLSGYADLVKEYVTQNIENQYIRKTVSFLFSTHNGNYLYYESPTFYIRES